MVMKINRLKLLGLLGALVCLGLIDWLMLQVLKDLWDNPETTNFWSFVAAVTFVVLNVLVVKQIYEKLYK